MNKSRLSILVIVLFGTTQAIGQDSLGLQRYSSFLNFWDWGNGLTLAGDYLYASTGQTGLRILDVSDPASPTEVARLYGRDNVGNVDNCKILGNFAYMQESYGINICDISNPLEPRIIGSYRGDGYPEQYLGVQDYDIRDSLLYIGYNGGGGSPVGLRILDVSHPERLRVLGNYTRNGISQIILYGDYAYCVCDRSEEGRFLILDVSNPQNITRVGYLPFMNLSGVGMPLTLVHDFLYVSASDTLHVLDLSDPEHPQEVFSVEEPTIYYRCIIQDLLLVGHSQILRSIDISDPAHPMFSAQYSIREDYIGHFTTDGEILYNVTGNHPKLLIYDVSDLENIQPVYTGFEGATISDIKLSDNELAYVVSKGDNYDWLSILSVNFLDEPELLSHTPIGPRGGGFGYPRCAVTGNKLVFTTGYGWGVMDVTNPNTPQRLYFEEGNGYDIAANDNLAYVSRTSRGLCIYSLEEPDVPTLLGQYNDSQSFQSMILADTIVINNALTYSERGGMATDSILLIDVSDPSRPQRLSGFRETAFLQDINPDGWASDGRTVFVVDRYGERVKITDISDRLNPVNRGTFDLDTLSIHTKCTQFDGKYLFCAFWGYGVKVYKTQFDSLRLVGLDLMGFYNYYNPGSRSLVYRAPYLFVADEYQVNVFDCSGIDDLLSTDPAGAYLTPESWDIAAFPNPFNSTVTISFSLPPLLAGGELKGGLSLRIYDLSGRLVADMLSEHPPLTPPASGGGKYSVVWDAGGLAAGVYLIKLESGGKSFVRKTVLIR